MNRALMSLSDEHLKTEALRMAVRHCIEQNKTPREITKCAETFYTFLKTSKANPMTPTTIGEE